MIRRHHGVKLAQVRRAIDFLRRELGVPRPLATQQFLTNGVALFVEHAGELRNVSEQGQQALCDEFALALARIEFGGHGGPVLLFPFTHNAAQRDDQLDADLREAGIPFAAHREHFAGNTPDVEWIAEVGRRGWAVLARDQEIRRRPNELAAVRAARIPVRADVGHAAGRRNRGTVHRCMAGCATRRGAPHATRHAPRAVNLPLLQRHTRGTAYGPNAWDPNRFGRAGR